MHGVPPSSRPNHLRFSGFNFSKSYFVYAGAMCKPASPPCPFHKGRPRAMHSRWCLEAGYQFEKPPRPSLESRTPPPPPPLFHSLLLHCLGPRQPRNSSFLVLCSSSVSKSTTAYLNSARRLHANWKMDPLSIAASAASLAGAASIVSTIIVVIVSSLPAKSRPLPFTPKAPLLQETIADGDKPPRSLSDWLK